MLDPYGMAPLEPEKQLAMIKPTPDQYMYPKSSIAPGKVVWAKVEGHEWWPAKVVRRRAVPKEVGVPAGTDPGLH
jgi:hypothetical protein